jgi:hypothetical protein
MVGGGGEKGGKEAYRGVKGHRDEKRGGVREKKLRGKGIKISTIVPSISLNPRSRMGSLYK